MEYDNFNNENKLKLINHKRGKIIKFFSLFIIFMSLSSFLFIGFPVNILQLVLLITEKISSNKTWILYHKRINIFLLYIIFCPILSMLYYWNNIKINTKLKNFSLIEDLNKPMVAIMLSNHSYELDYLICCILADQLYNIGSVKTVSKNDLKFLPIVGWAFWFNGYIFVKRNWLKDRQLLEKKLIESFDYEQFIFGFFAEGTRFSETKLKFSKEYSKSIGLKPLKYHLEPRSKGFVFTVRYYLKEFIENNRRDRNLFKIYNLEIIMKENLNIKQLIFGDKLEGDIYLEEIKIPDDICQEVLNSKDENDCPKLGRFLRKIYERKDELVEQYRNNNNEFVLNSKTGGTYPFRARKTPLVVWLVGFTLTYSFIGYWLVFKSYATSIKF